MRAHTRSTVDPDAPRRSTGSVIAVPPHGWQVHTFTPPRLDLAKSIPQTGQRMGWACTTIRRELTLGSDARADDRCGAGRRWNRVERRCMRDSGRTPVVCSPDEHASRGHCCALGETWSNAQRSCVCVEAAACLGSIHAAPAAPTSPFCTRGMGFVPGGTFVMGSDRLGYVPEHRVTVSPYCMHLTEVSLGDYQRCVSVGACAAIDPNSLALFEETAAGPDRYPAYYVGWDQASTYCERVGARLPTEAEWEFAAHGTDGRLYPWGSEGPDGTRANLSGLEDAEWRQAASPEAAPEPPLPGHRDDYVRLAPVGSFPAGASPFGMLDMVGNVAEWTADRYGPYVALAQIDPTGPTRGRGRVRRGGDFWTTELAWANAVARQDYPPSARVVGPNRGFRCARSPLPGASP